MKRIRILVSILCACFVSVAWSQQPAGKCINNWSEFHRTNMKRWNPCEKVLNVKNVGSLQNVREAASRTRSNNGVTSETFETMMDIVAAYDSLQAKGCASSLTAPFLP